MKYVGLWVLLVVCLSGTVGLPFFINDFIKNQKLWLAVLLGCIDAGAFVGAYILRDVISREGFSGKWSSVVKRAFGNLEATYYLAGFSHRDGARITLFAPHQRKKNCLVQITPYFPTKEFGSFKRCLDVSKGIVGKCFRTGEAQIQVVNRNADYRSELVTKWGFTEEETRKISSDKRAFLALPIVNKNDKVGAIVYLDAKSRTAFDVHRIALINKVRVAIAEWA
jgi:hypothetical protein